MDAGKLNSRDGVNSSNMYQISNIFVPNTQTQTLAQKKTLTFA